MVSKRGTAFVCIVSARQRRPAVWDPHHYRGAEVSGRLGDYADVHGLQRSSHGRRSPFRAIEYSDIGRGDQLTFTLASDQADISAKLGTVGEQELLMGTMRAYLGNVIVTPRAAWLGRKGPLTFAVKSEFVRLVPQDGLIYFWWAYLRSERFLARLPAGSGGTRPRLQAAGLAATMVEVPELEARTRIHQQLEAGAAREWRETRRRRMILDLLR